LIKPANLPQKLSSMKSFILIFSLALMSFVGKAQQSGKPSAPDPKKKLMTVEASCGPCKFGLKGGTCDLAIKLDGKAYFVDGTDINEHGDAHADDGFCNAVRKAKVQGEVKDDRFKATYFQLLPEPVKGKKA
jgi:hypothetical protein